MVGIGDAIHDRSAQGEASNGCKRLRRRLERSQRMQSAVEQPLLGDVDERRIVRDSLEARSEQTGAPLGSEGRKLRVLRSNGRILDGETGGGGVDDARGERARGTEAQRDDARAQADGPPRHEGIGPKGRGRGSGLGRYAGSIAEAGADATAGWPFRRSFHVSSWPLRLPFGTSFRPSGAMVSVYSSSFTASSRRRGFSSLVAMFPDRLGG